MIRTIRKLFLCIKKWDALCVLVLLTVTLFTRIVLINEAPVVYAQDAYIYFSEAMDFANNGTIEFRTGMPFILILGASAKLLGPFVGELYSSRLLMLVASVILFFTLYKIGKKLSGRLLGLFAGLLAIFEPYCLKYSTVPYLEVFAISTGLLAFYFTLSRRKLLMFLAPILFYVAVLTRPEFYLPLVVPIVFICLYKNCKIHSKQKITELLGPLFFVFVVYLLPFIFIYSYVSSWSVFGIAQRIDLFLTPKLLSTTIESAFRFYDQQLLNQLIYFYVLAILGFILLKTFFHVGLNRTGEKFKILVKSTMSTNVLFSDDHKLTAFCLFLLSSIYIIVLTLFAYGYNWAYYVAPADMTNIHVLKDAVIISSNLHDRYLILLRLLMSFTLAYPLTVLTRKVWKAFVHQN